MPSVGVVVPAYRPNPAALGAYLDSLDEALDPEAIRVELDAPSQATLDALADVPATLAVSDARRGKGRAITDGFDALDTDVLTFADADGSVPASSLARVVERVDSNLVVGSRRHPDADVRSHQSFLRRTFGDVFAGLARTLLDVRLHDYQCGAKALSKSVWERVRGHLTETGFAWDVELVAMVDALGYDVVEVPVTWDDDPASTVDPLQTAGRLFRALVSVRRRARSVDRDRTRDRPTSERAIARNAEEGGE
ncbi:glycosyltransferase [Halospeciosus flavus]|uniref:Glycosyltransferase n=1 Tax=Halospeciosus flavus TaxID=3032283 RepID=A0ABD5Z0R0_9EURY|nr:glycosyltransferase [Halospeciosus flavus]